MAFQHQGQLLALWAEQAGSPALLGHLELGWVIWMRGWRRKLKVLLTTLAFFLLLTGHVEGKALAKVPQSWPYGVRAQRKVGKMDTNRI